MTKTAARHRAPLSPRAWAHRVWWAVSALPVGALAGCAALTVATTADRPALGLLGLGAAVLPLSVATWRSRLTEADPAHGRRAAGRPLAGSEAGAAASPDVRADAHDDAHDGGRVDAGSARDPHVTPLVLAGPDLAAAAAAAPLVVVPSFVVVGEASSERLAAA